MEGLVGEEEGRGGRGYHPVGALSGEKEREREGVCTVLEHGLFGSLGVEGVVVETPYLLDSVSRDSRHGCEQKRASIASLLFAKSVDTFC